jgi:hypothetical protein
LNQQTLHINFIDNIGANSNQHGIEIHVYKYLFVNNLLAIFFNFRMVLGLFNSAIPYKDQQYSKLKSQCVSKGELFVDPLFPPTSKSLFYSKVEKNIVWKRPGVSYCLNGTSRKSVNS